MNDTRRLRWGFILIGTAVLLILEQYLLYGHVFDFDQILHHEYFASIFFVIGIMLLLAKRIAH